MLYAEIIKCLAPCGLNCVKCIGFDEGDIKKHSNELKRLLGSFDNYAERFSDFDPNLKERWIKINNRMKAIGLEAYYEETKDAPRYI